MSCLSYLINYIIIIDGNFKCFVGFSLSIVTTMEKWTGVRLRNGSCWRKNTNYTPKIARKTPSKIYRYSGCILYVQIFVNSCFEEIFVENIISWMHVAHSHDSTGAQI